MIQGDACYGVDYARALTGAKIAIGLLSKRIPETTTTRSFEIPACGTMLLAERTQDHQALFEEGVEAEFFDSAEECADKARFYSPPMQPASESLRPGCAGAMRRAIPRRPSSVRSSTGSRRIAQKRRFD